MKKISVLTTGGERVSCLPGGGWAGSREAWPRWGRRERPRAARQGENQLPSDWMCKAGEGITCDSPGSRAKATGWAVVLLLEAGARREGGRRGSRRCQRCARWERRWTLPRTPQLPSPPPHLVVGRLQRRLLHRQVGSQVPPPHVSTCPWGGRSIEDVWLWAP